TFPLIQQKDGCYTGALLFISNEPSNTALLPLLLRINSATIISNSAAPGDFTEATSLIVCDLICQSSVVFRNIIDLCQTRINGLKQRQAFNKIAHFYV
ncbi:MAG: hypothetical protein LE168_05665, partial [Endomicrobium sp.]|nr:hypothetical protein [Endomicrobium sp.]